MKYKAVVIGCGRIGCGFDDNPERKIKIMTHANAYLHNDKTELVGLVDIDEEKLKKYGAKFNARTYLEAEKALETEKPDIVSICTHQDTHYELVKLAVKHGAKAIWCEKPFTMTVNEGKEIENVCKKKNVVLMVNFIRRFEPTFHKIRKMLGTIDALDIDAVYSGGFWNNGSHILDVFRLWFGEINEVEGRKSKAPPRTDADPNLDGTIKFENGLRANITASDEKNGLQFMIHVKGNNGELIMDQWNITLKMNKDEEKLSELGQQNYMVNALNNIIESIENNESVLCTAEDGWKAVEVVEAFHKSCATNMPITISSDNKNHQEV